MSEANLATRQELQAFGQGIDQLSHGLRQHIEADHASAHVGLTATASTAYQDSHGDTWGNHVVAVLVGGTTYYIPVTLVT